MYLEMWFPISELSHVNSLRAQSVRNETNALQSSYSYPVKYLFFHSHKSKSKRSSAQTNRTELLDESNSIEVSIEPWVGFTKPISCIPHLLIF